MKINIPFLKMTFLTVLLFCSLLPMSCSSDDDASTPPMDMVNYENLTEEELTFLAKALAVDEELNTLWSTFQSFRDHPIFIVTGENEGIFINPPSSQLEESRPLLNEFIDYEDLAIYRNDELLAFALSELTNGLFFGFYEYDGFPLFIYNITQEPATSFYSAYKNRNGHYHVSVFFHELFHAYQNEVGDLYFDPEFESDFFGYPINEDTLPLLLLLFDVMSDAHLVGSISAQNRYLEYYVSIQSELNALDPTPNNLIRNHGFFIEKLEGAPRYVEVFGTLNAINNNTVEDPTHGFKEFSETLASSLQVRQVYGRRIFYHTGAGAIHLLKSLGYPNVQDAFLIPSNTPYNISEAFLNLTSAEKDAVLEEVKTIYTWKSLVARSEYLLTL